MDVRDYDKMLEALARLSRKAGQKEVDDICMVLDIRPQGDSAAQMPSQLHAQIGEYHIARRGLEPVGDVLAQALQQNATHRAHRQPQAQPCRHGSLEKSAQGQEGQTDGGLGQHGLQERKDKGQLDPPLIGAGYGQDSFHQRDHASSPPFSAETRQAAAPSAARHSFS